MTKAERAEVRALIAEAPKALAPIFESFLRAITALEEKDALIADLFSFATTTTPDDSPYVEYQERLAALKARAAL